MRQLEHLLSGDNNLVPLEEFRLCWGEIEVNSEKKYTNVLFNIVHFFYSEVSYKKLRDFLEHFLER